VILNGKQKILFGPGQILERVEIRQVCIHGQGISERQNLEEFYLSLADDGKI
jgi:hypothetical protein